MTTPPSGEQYPIELGPQRATIVQVGGGIREYRVGDREVLESYPIDAMADGAHGAPLIPWPNRLEDGRYSFDGADYQVDVSETDKNNAIHGFLRWQPWEARTVEPSKVVVGTGIFPRSGFPFALDIQIEYRLGDEGLVVETVAENVGERRCPFGAGQHPYLSPGSGPASGSGSGSGSGFLDDCLVRLDADTRLLTDSERQLPVGTEAVAGTDFDFRGSGRRLGDVAVDHAFTGLSRDGDGRAWAELGGADGRTVRLWADEHYPYIQLYTGDTLGADRRRRGMGCEPMTCPANAFRTGDHLTVLDPGQSVTLRWGVQLV